MIMTGCSTTLVEVNNINDLEDRNVGIYTGSEYDTILNKKFLQQKHHIIIVIVIKYRH